MASVPSVRRLRERHRARGLRVLGVTEIDNDERATEVVRARAAAERHRIDYPCLLDDGGAWMAAAGIAEVPMSVIVSRRGLIVFAYPHPVRPGSTEYATLEGAIVGALAAPRPPARG